MWGKQSFFPMYGVTGDGLGTWTVDIFWGNAISNPNAVEHIKTFQPSKIDPNNVQAQATDLNLKRSIVEDAFKQKVSFDARNKAVEYMEKLKIKQPLKSKA